jgi:hypothetical protein
MYEVIAATNKKAGSSSAGIRYIAANIGQDKALSLIEKILSQL